MIFVPKPTSQIDVDQVSFNDYSGKFNPRKTAFGTISSINYGPNNDPLRIVLPEMFVPFGKKEWDSSSPDQPDAGKVDLTLTFSGLRSDDKDQYDLTNHSISFFSSLFDHFAALIKDHADIFYPKDKNISIEKIKNLGTPILKKQSDENGTPYPPQLRSRLVRSKLDPARFEGVRSKGRTCELSIYDLETNQSYYSEHFDEQLPPYSYVIPVVEPSMIFVGNNGIWSVTFKIIALARTKKGGSAIAESQLVQDGNEDWQSLFKTLVPKGSLSWELRQQSELGPE